ncbi:beta-propeller fold lactonase family protein [Coralloluteibacterium thermophilus]|uniref:Beta-propeller fold lactonase family protein n=1 Tax=Coralloluteibacterium thermophilum TaxID=2707049 RepID=A0ABV9NGP8_9GAMM
MPSMSIRPHWRTVAVAVAAVVLLAACGREQSAVSTAVAADVAPASAAVHAYVPNQRSGTISIIDTGSDSVVRTLSGGGLGNRIQQIMVAPGGDSLLVVDAAAHRLVELDIASDRIRRSVDIGENAEGVTASPSGEQLAVCVEGENEVMLIDEASFEIGAHIPTQGRAPEHCVYTPDGRFLLTSNEASSDLDVIDVASATSVGLIEVSGHPRGMAFAPDGNIVYVAQESADVVDVVDLAQRSRVASIPAGLRTAGLALSPDGSRLYASNGGAHSVTVIDTASRQPIGEIPVGQRPWNPALTPDGAKLYVANGRSNSVSVIDTETMQEIAQIPVGEMPWGVIIPH